MHTTKYENIYGSSFNVMKCKAPWLGFTPVLNAYLIGNSTNFCIGRSKRRSGAILLPSLSKQLSARVT